MNKFDQLYDSLYDQMTMDSGDENSELTDYEAEIKATFCSIGERATFLQ